jgi:RNase adaptor protein for sRNA GlmZ degradation
MTTELAEAPAPGRLQIPDLVTIVTFGYAWGTPPQAHAVFDARHHFGNPDLGPGLRELTGEDPRVQAAVLEACGMHDLVDVVTRTAWTFLNLYSGQRDVVIAVGCRDGRQRSVAIAREASALLGYEGTPVALYDRDVNRPAVPGSAS